jgi:hypothetical protein
MSVAKKIAKPITKFSPQVRSKHPSYDNIRGRLGKFPFRSVVRFGSLFEYGDEVRLGGRRIEINSPQSIRNSASKLLMKQCFTRAGVKTADWWTQGALNDWARDKFPIIAKHHFGARGEGNTKLDNQQALEAWMRGKTLSNYIFEKFYTYSKEYRLHVSINGECFYACRKVLKRDTNTEDRWHRHDDNCAWLIDTNPNFERPSNWNDIVSDCVNALRALGGDVMGFDVKTQSARDSKNRLREYPEWIILESNSACSLGDITTQKYLEQIPKVLKYKYENRE